MVGKLKMVYIYKIINLLIPSLIEPDNNELFTVTATT